MSIISSLSSYLQNIGLVQTSQDEIAKLTYQVDTGLKSEDLQGYGTQANQLLNLQSAQVTEQNYVSNNTQTQTFVSAYDTTLSQIQGDASKLSASLDAFSVTDPDAVTNLQALVKALQVDVGATLNTEVGGRYLYGGTNYTTQPVGDLTALPAPTFVTPATTPPTVTPLTVTDGTVAQSLVPPYSTQATLLNSSTTPTTSTLPSSTLTYSQAAAQTYATQTTAIANNQTTTYGVTANNPTFQHLVYALQCAQAAASTNTSTAAGQANQAALIQQATSEISVALNGSPAVTGPPAVAQVDSLQSLQDQNGTADLALSNANTVHNQTLATLQSQITTIDQVDPATVATELSAAQNTLEGSYKVVSSVLNETLLNYLK
jgi:flagellar hook-associated protein 3 FlgL